MATVKIIVNGQEVEVEETSPGLFGQLGYSYAGAPSTPTPSNAITSASLAPAPATNFQTYTPPTSFPIESLTPEGKKAQDYSSKLIDYSSQLLGESQFRSEQEKSVGLSELETTQDDLTSQLKGLIAESKAIPLQIQEEFKGRGVTAGGIAPIEAGKLRENAIKSLSVSAQLDAVGGKVTSALRKIDKAVSEKYDSIREQVKVASFNLQTILDSPQYSAEVKAKAQAQLDAQNKKKAETDAAADNEKSIKEALIKLIYANPNIDPFTRQKLDAAKDPLELATIASQAGLNFEKPGKKDLTFAAGSLEEFKYLYGRDPKDVAELNSFTAARSAAGRAPEELKVDKPLETVDIQRIQELYGVTVPLGTTQKQAEALIAQANTPEVKTRNTIQQLKDAGASYEEIIGELTDETEKKIAQEVFGITEETKQIQPFFGKGNFIKIDGNERAKELSEMGFSSTEIRDQLIKEGYDKNLSTSAANQYGGAFSSFMNNITNYLFGE